MADVPASAPVSSVGAAGSGSGAGGAGGGVLSGPAQLLRLPQSLEGSNQTVVLGARLVGSNPDGSVVLGTAQGNVTLVPPFPIQTQSALQIQIQNGTPPTATLTLLNANVAAQRIANPVFVGAPDSGLPFAAATTQNTPVNVMDKNTSGLQISAIVIGELPAPVASAAPRKGDAALPSATSTSAPSNSLANPVAVSADKTQFQEKINVFSSYGAQPTSAPLAADAAGRVPLPAGLIDAVQQARQQLQQLPPAQSMITASTDVAKALPALFAVRAADGTAAAFGASSTEKLSPGTQLSLRLLQSLPPGVPAPNPPVPNTITGRVTGQTLNDLPLVQTDRGAIVLQSTESRLPAGTTLIFGLPQAAPQTAGQGGASVVQTAATAGAGTANTRNTAFPALEASLQALSSADPAAFQTLAASLPRLNGNFPPTVLFFLQAIQKNDPQQFLGTKGAEAIRRMGPEGARLLAAMEVEFKALSTPASPSNSPNNANQAGDWRVFTLPYMAENGLANFQFGVRNQFQDINPDERREKNLDAAAGRVTRFVFDISFSEFGPMQVDGLLRPRTDYTRQLDILLRTRELLPQPIRQNLRDIFSDSLQTYGLAGMLTFQAGYQNWIRLMPGAAQHTARQA